MPYFVIFEKAAKFENCRLLQIIGGAVMLQTNDIDIASNFA